jgi:hypothetical protein
MNWLTCLKLQHREQRIAFEEMLLAVQARERIGRLEQAMREALANWVLAPVVEALNAMRGIGMIGAASYAFARRSLGRSEQLLSTIQDFSATNAPPNSRIHEHISARR